MASFNKVILMGNLTRDPELKRTPSGAAVCELRLAVSESYRKDGERVEKVMFIDVVVWNQQAENCNQYLSKGSPIFVEGRLQYDEWKNDKGETRSKIRVVASRTQFIGGNRGQGTATHPDAETSPNTSAPRVPDNAVQEFGQDDDFEDVPF